MFGHCCYHPRFSSPLQTNPGNPNVKQPGSGTAQQIKQVLRKDSFLKSRVFIESNENWQKPAECSTQPFQPPRGMLQKHQPFRTSCSSSGSGAFSSSTAWPSSCSVPWRQSRREGEAPGQGPTKPGERNPKRVKGDPCLLPAPQSPCCQLCTPAQATFLLGMAPVRSCCCLVLCPAPSTQLPCPHPIAPVPSLVTSGTKTLQAHHVSITRSSGVRDMSWEGTFWTVLGSEGKERLRGHRQQQW